ncbi:unnamed protein product [Fusarium equiseti]|uniref:RING-type domain-containing protein n=1 Tax=Fusarium equiseti TaxID=61235 RepID=A0A8J2NCW7_FUSEQ|nr:unnamed protein product [Fusarium equiseti]
MSDLHSIQGSQENNANNGQSPSFNVNADGQQGNQCREEHYWPTIRKHALGQASLDEAPIRCVCPVCNSQISAAGLPRPGGEAKEGLITPCGHVVCYECWPEVALRSEPEDYAYAEQRKCPVCDELLECSRCGRGCIKQKVLEYSCDVQEIEAVLPTIPETMLLPQAFCIECLGFVPTVLGSWFPFGTWALERARK